MRFAGFALGAGIVSFYCIHWLAGALKASTVDDSTNASRAEPRLGVAIRFVRGAAER
jgi:hypothetical protein